MPGRFATATKHQVTDALSAARAGPGLAAAIPSHLMHDIPPPQLDPESDSDEEAAAEALADAVDAATAAFAASALRRRGSKLISLMNTLTAPSDPRTAAEHASAAAATEVGDILKHAVASSQIRSALSVRVSAAELDAAVAAHALEIQASRAKLDVASPALTAGAPTHALYSCPLICIMPCARPPLAPLLTRAPVPAETMHTPPNAGPRNKQAHGHTHAAQPHATTACLHLSHVTAPATHRPTHRLSPRSVQQTLQPRQLASHSGPDPSSTPTRWITSEAEPATKTRRAPCFLTACGTGDPSSSSSTNHAGGLAPTAFDRIGVEITGIENKVVETRCYADIMRCYLPTTTLQSPVFIQPQHLDCCTLHAFNNALQALTHSGARVVLNRATLQEADRG